MNNKIKKELKKIICIFLIELIILLPIAIADSLTISNVRAEDITDISARIKWETNNPAEGSVNFGKAASLGQKESSPNFVKDHSILLSSLTEDTQYYFEVTSDDGTEIIVNNNNNSLYKFTTLPKKPLFVNASIPPYYNQGHTINVEGNSIRLAKVEMYVNNEIPRTLNADNNGKFLFPNINLNEGNNTIRLTAESQGQTIEKTYSIKVDTTAPTVIINEIPNIVGSEIIKINGSVNEPVTISFYAAGKDEDTAPPPKITNLTGTSVEEDLIELSWNKINITDFGKYIIYRNNIPIAIIPDTDYNDYSDAFVNSNQTYTYKVAAMDSRGNLGESSDPLTVKTLEGRIKDRPEPEEVDIYEDIKGLQKTIKTNNTFTEEIKLGSKDGFYNVKIEAIDTAENKWTYEKEILVDTKDPEIEIISPKGNAQIFENYADMVTIRGKTEPGARIYLYVKRTPFAEFNKTWDIYGTPEKLQDLPEADLRADCRVEVQGKEQCKTHADYETIADADGYFEFENVDLTSMWGGAFRITEYPTGEPYYEFVRERELKDYMESSLFFVAVDAAGRKGVEQADYEIVTCWSTDLTWDATPLVEYQSPTFLNIERLKEGTEAIYFYFNFTYHGRGIETKNTKITNLLVSKACGSGYLEKEERYEYSCKILRSCTEKLSPNGKTAYIACPLGRMEGIEKWSDNDWKSFIDSVKDEMVFPFKLTITYDEEYDNKTITRGRTHYFCTEVGYDVDATRINPKEILPDWLLYDFVGFLNNSISRLNEWIDKLRQILEWASIGCMVSFFVKFVTQIYRRMTCYYNRFFKKLQRIGEDTNKEDECRLCIEQYEDKKVLKKFNDKEDVQDLLSDTCLEKCYQTCSNAWKSEESLYKTYRWACDRVFGHQSPSRWTETVSTNKLYEKATAGSSCANDESVRGKPLRVVSCKSLEDKYRETFSRDETCFEITNLKDHKEELYMLEEPAIEQNLYKINKITKKGAEVTYNYVIKQNENYYLTNQDRSCEEICTGRGEVAITQVKEKDGVFTFETAGTKEESQESVSAMCTTTNQCLNFKKGNKYTTKDGQTVEIKQDSEPRGYTTDCFYDAIPTPGSKVLYTGSLRNTNVVSGDPDQRMECCCINSDKAISPVEYYLPSDIETKDGKERGEGSDLNEEGLRNMKWSYRYYKEHYQAKSEATGYDPNRYIEGRDVMACFGQNILLYDGFKSGTEEGSLLIIDPAKQTLAAFQCIAISQILNRLALLKNMMVALENCLLTIRTTGEADSGVCKEIFTQYICAFIWKVISFFRDGCLPFGKGIDFANSENKVLEAVSVGMRGVWDSVADSQQELASEYGNAQLNNLLGMGEQDVFRKVCLAAFGYDWEINAESLVDVAYHSPYATLVQPILPSREYLTFDPTNYQSKYDYRASWLVNPGCDLDNYEVYLACVTRNDMYSNDDIDCSKQQDPYGRNCDCLDLSPDKAPAPLFYYQSRGKLKQNELQNVDSTQITNRIKTSPYRYDHLMFKLRVDRNYEKNKGDISKCFPTGHEDGIFYFPITDYTTREIEGCYTDITTGIFSCSKGASFFYEEGSAWFNEIEVADSVTKNILEPQKATYYAGSNDAINAIVRYSKDERKQCLIARLMDKDHTTVISAPKAIDLRKGETTGEEQTGAIYRIADKDISGGGYGFTIGYTDEKGNTIPGAAKLSYKPTKKADQPGGGSLTFIDNLNNGEGIIISGTSTDKYSYNGETKEISECYSAGGCNIKLDNIGAEIKISEVHPTKPGEYSFFVQYVGGAEQQATLEPRFYLYLDLRYPKTPDGDCDEVRGVEYDDSQIIVSNGIRQSVEIPIYVLPGESTKESCAAKYEKEEIREKKEDGTWFKKEKVCVCGTGATKNCPTKDYNFCYGTCRKYPRCEYNIASNSPCVCDPDLPATRYDCGGSSTGADARFEGISRVGWYCYQKPGDKNLTCNQEAPSGIATGPQDVTPLQITLHSPKNNAVYNTGEKITVYATIQDDMVTGSEKYKIIVNSDTKFEEENTEKKEVWVIRKEIDADDFKPGEDVFIFIQATDNSMASGQKIAISDVAQIKIEAKT